MKERMEMHLEAGRWVHHLLSHFPFHRVVVVVVVAVVVTVA
jgi:hypothetical protein